MVIQFSGRQEFGLRAIFPHWWHFHAVLPDDRSGWYQFSRSTQSCLQNTFFNRLELPALDPFEGRLVLS